MVRVDRLYLGPMSAPDQLGRDKLPAPLGTSGDKLWYRDEIGSRTIA
jgi:hypothetical protein